MELLTAANIVLFASLTLLLSFLITKLVSFSIPHTTTTTNKLNQLRHVSSEPLTVQTESKVQFQLPTNIETDHNKEKVNEETKAESNAVEADLNGSVAEQRNKDCDSIEKISVEKQSSVEQERDVILDDWEGIERTELEKEFMAATEFVVGNNGSKSVGNDVEMELYGLHKVATEGPCRQPQPMPLMLSARAKWNAWQKLGNMSPEVAMEQYISLVSDKVPGWIKYASAGIRKHELVGSEISESVAAHLSTSLSHQQMILTDRELEQEKESSAHDRSPLTEAGLENNVKK
ncbi:PREDICTED: acyl-CoA-binding domain-containing protein 2-like isoform X1 [Lupinus angustifolius]|uniref:acyl-CoA-binding domain-containing protein 2-like isoform X1 n=2 Tax=Lupinus angustifolius TaxID=3871 RepID=UPI00092E652E|nr:PREDICTED: acyl-CoA-binding domain-containing protein 2-like isoform X1 [Lupinus angustifolius]